MATADISTTTRRKLTPREVADQFGVAPEKVVAWIQAGELRAIDAATKRGQRPRYLIDVDDLAEFERSREIVPDRPQPRRRKQREQSKFYPHS